LSTVFSFHATAPTHTYTLSLHDALPISAAHPDHLVVCPVGAQPRPPRPLERARRGHRLLDRAGPAPVAPVAARPRRRRGLHDLRSEERRVGKECRSGGWAGE